MWFTDLIYFMIFLNAGLWKPIDWNMWKKVERTLNKSSLQPRCKELFILDIQLAQLTAVQPLGSTKLRSVLASRQDAQRLLELLLFQHRLAVLPLSILQQNRLKPFWRHLWTVSEHVELWKKSSENGRPTHQANSEKACLGRARKILLHLHVVAVLPTWPTSARVRVTRTIEPSLLFPGIDRKQQKTSNAQYTLSTQWSQDKEIRGRHYLQFAYFGSGHLMAELMKLKLVISHLFKASEDTYIRAYMYNYKQL